MNLEEARRSIEENGYALLQGVLDTSAIGDVVAALGRGWSRAEADEAVRTRGGDIYAARNLTRLCPETLDLPRRLAPLLLDILGPDCGLVRGLFFDKPPEHSWSLTWHQDCTIAVREHLDSPSRFVKPTRKAGVPHVEAPRELLERMLTLRFHLDQVTHDNGPLLVLPGTHRGPAAAPPAAVLCEAGDVLAMRPLLSHGSPSSLPGETRRRRIVHLEFAADPQLPDGYAWHEFLPLMR